MANDYVESFNPLTKDSRGPTDPQLRLAYAQSQVRSVIDSYHGRIDVFAEAIQNSVDAIEKRWSEWDGTVGESESLDSVPRLRVTLDFDTNSVEVIDNGTGISASGLAELLEPFVSDKRFGSMAQRGHKGVGTTFLAYGHPAFEIHTKTKDMQSSVGYAIHGGRAWATAPVTTPPPDFIRVECHPSLDNYESGTYVKITLDQTTNLKSLNVLHNTPLMWATILRSNTAAGYVTVNIDKTKRPAWAKYLKITLDHKLEGTEQMDFQFPYPHLAASEETRELQWLTNNNDTNRAFTLIYVERTHDELRSLLKNEIAELEDSEDEVDREILKTFHDYQVSIYASIAYKNTFYEEQFRELIKKPNAKKLSLVPGVGGGVMVASVGMPMGGLQPHLLETMKPEERRRYFLLIHFNEKYSPDIGRKTIPQQVESLVSWLEMVLLKLLRNEYKRLLKDRESGTRATGATLTTANQELKAWTQKIVDLEQLDDELNFDGLLLQRSPRWEPEVVAIFLDLLRDRRLPGYRIRAIPGGESRYDALFDYLLTAEDQKDVPKKLKVSDHQLGSGIDLSSCWLEFKKDINSFITDLEEEALSPAKKYFTHVDLLVVWSVSQITSDVYSVVPITAANSFARNFVGSTYFIEAENNDHRVEVICLQELVALFYGDTQNL